MKTLQTSPAGPAPDDELFETAINMAATAFDAVTDDHVQGVFDRLVWNADHGLGGQGATTVH